MGELRTNTAAKLLAGILEAKGKKDTALAAKQARLLELLAQQARRDAAAGQAGANSYGADVLIEPGPPSKE